MDGDGNGLSEKLIAYGWPTIMLLDEEMRIMYIGTNQANFTSALEYLEDLVDDGTFTGNEE